MKIARNNPLYLLPVLCCSISMTVSAQMITGVWKGRINHQKVELKLVQDGDSLRGSSYYYESPNNYRRYSIRGYFDSKTNEAVWWDDQLLEEKTGRFSVNIPGKVPLLSRADFNCPGSGRMMLDGKATRKEEGSRINGEVDLDKTTTAAFEDDWDYVIDNYTIGANDPDIIDSISLLTNRTIIPEPEPEKTITTERKTVFNPPVEKTAEKKVPEPVNPVISEPVQPQTIEEKFTTRKKVFIKEIPVSGDSIELRFYDNAEIDGDSISLFLNDKLLFSHIRLTASAYIIKIPLSELASSNELIMVAENMGAIPPNTSYMLAIANGQRYEAYLASTEGSSAMIRLIKKE